MAFRVGDWLVEPSLNRLSRGEASVKLEPKVMELLVLLAEHPDEVVTKEKILERLWPGTYVTESSLFRHVSELRRALGDDRKHPHFVQTIPKKGYRLVITALENPRVPAPRARRRLALLGGLLATVLALAATMLLFHNTTKSGRRVDRDAREAYLRGELFENRVDCRSFDQAIDAYSEAMHRERGYADVYPRLFDALVASAVLGCRPPQPLFTELESLLDIAARNGLDETRRVQGRAALTLWRDGDVPSALGQFQEAAERATSKDTEDFSYAVALVISGRPEEGLDEARRCLEALPVDLGENWALGGILYLTGRYDEAITQFRATLDLYPGYRPAEQLLAMSYLMAGDKEQALAAAERAEPAPDEPLQRFDAVPGYVYAVLGNRERAKSILDMWQARAATDWVPKTSLALLHLGLGERKEAVRWLDEARREGDPWVVLTASDPCFRELSKPLPAGNDESSEAFLRNP